MAVETAAEASMPSKSQIQPAMMVMQHLHLIIWKLENDWDRREKWIKKRDKLLDEQINLYQCVRRRRQLYRWIAMNRHKGNDNLECGDWAIACVQIDRRLETLMRMTTFSPFQYQVQFKLMIQISDSISNDITLLFVANLPIVAVFPFGVCRTVPLFNKLRNRKWRCSVYYTNVWTTNSQIIGTVNESTSCQSTLAVPKCVYTHTENVYNVDVHWKETHLAFVYAAYNE